MWQGSVVGSVRCASYSVHRTCVEAMKATAAEPAWGGLVSEGVVIVKKTLHNPSSTIRKPRNKTICARSHSGASWRPTGAPIRCSYLSKSPKAKTNL